MAKTITVYSKMAEGGKTDDVLLEIGEVLKDLDQDMANILMQYGDIDDAEIEIEMADGFSKQTLSETRLKIFEVAKEKAARCLQRPNASGIFGPDYTADAFEDELLSKSAVDQWELVIRRKKNNFAKDTIELLAFSLDDEAEFPAKIIKNPFFNRGTFENVPEAEDSAIAQLRNDIERSNGTFAVEIVTGEGNAERHLITIDNPEDPIEDNDEQTADEEDSADESDDPSTGTQENESAEKCEGLCLTCGARKASDPLLDLVKSFVDMSKYMFETNEGRPPAARSSIASLREYIEKMVRETDAKMKKILEWQKVVDGRLNDIENRQVGRHMPTPIPKDDCIQEDYGLKSDDEQIDPPADDVPLRRRQQNTNPDHESREKTYSQNQGAKPKTNVRKLYPPRSVQSTPNPRLKNLDNKKGKAKAPADPPRAKENRPAGVYYEVSNPYGPLDTDDEVVSVDNGKRRSPSWGRGRGRGRAMEARPGPSTRQPPAKPTNNNAGRKTSTTRATTSYEPQTVDTSSSWYDEDDEIADQSLISASDNLESSDCVAGEENASAKYDQQNGGGHNVPAAADRQHETMRDKGRKRTSTKEAPVEVAQHGENRGKSEAPMSKKAKLDSKTPPHDTSYSDAVENGVWNRAGGKKKKKPRFTKGNIPELQSSAEVPFREVYVQELNCANCACNEDFELMVMEYCRKRSLNAVDACKIPIKNCRVKSGVKLTVHEADYEKAMDVVFWPRGSRVRPWNQKPKNESNDDDDGTLSE